MGPIATASLPPKSETEVLRRSVVGNRRYIDGCRRTIRDTGHFLDQMAAMATQVAGPGNIVVPEQPSLSTPTPPSSSRRQHHCRDIY